MCMNRANAAGITPSVDEATEQFSVCAKEKALREAALKEQQRSQLFEETTRLAA